MGGTTSKDSTLPNPKDHYSQPKPVEDADYSKPLPREKLPAALQNIVDNEDSLWDNVRDGHANDSTESNVRYAAYATRVRTILLSAQRYVAYTSDIGESFRPIAHPWLIKSAYGISWAYLIGDVSHEGYKAYTQQQALLNPASGSGVPAVQATNGTMVGNTVRPIVPAIDDYRTVMAQRAVFQSVASMGLPAFTIHSIVRYSGKALKNAKNARIRTYGPIGLGLAAVPFLPYMFDKPVEESVEWVFHQAFKTIGGPNAVGLAPKTGREELLANSTTPKATGKTKTKTETKEKEL